MGKKYIISIDQSTQGTKALLFDDKGTLLKRTDYLHKQIVTQEGWVSHDLTEIYHNTIAAVKTLVNESNIDKTSIVGVGISNQRETSAAWNKKTGEPIANAVVWQCARAKDICKRLEIEKRDETISQKTGLRLSPYFPAGKFAWILENVPEARTLLEEKNLCLGTIDSWLIYKLTGGKEFSTDYSNASRTQLFNIHTLEWDEEICRFFQIDPACLAKVCDSNSFFGETDFEGLLEQPVPIMGVLGDSHGALFGQGCLRAGMIKATYGTGSSIMMNIGEQPVLSESGIVTSIAWGMNGKVSYVLEGNINYTGAVISWLKDDLKLIDSAEETGPLVKEANPKDCTYFVPAFTGLLAPYWDSEAKANFSGISRTTGKAEMVKAALDSIAYQINDVIKVMETDAGMEIKELRVDGGPTKNEYLMQFQSDIGNIKVCVPQMEELSGIGAAFMAGIALNIYDDQIFMQAKSNVFTSKMEPVVRNLKCEGWKKAVKLVLTNSRKI